MKFSPAKPDTTGSDERSSQTGRARRTALSETLESGELASSEARATNATAFLPRIVRHKYPWRLRVLREAGVRTGKAPHRSHRKGREEREGSGIAYLRYYKSSPTLPSRRNTSPTPLRVEQPMGRARAAIVWRPLPPPERRGGNCFPGGDGYCHRSSRAAAAPPSNP